MRSGRTKSCGCYRDTIRYSHSALWEPTHGLSKHPLHQIWRDIKTRCYNGKSNNYKYYGGRGIKLCEEWRDFQAFYDWSINNGYKKGLSIDRIDPNGDYEPGNCRWTTMKVQQNNRRNNHIIAIDRVEKTMAEWAKIYGIPYTVVKSRISIGWDEKEALTKPKGSKRLDGRKL